MDLVGRRAHRLYELLRLKQGLARLVYVAEGADEA
jgi:hypothetical protein